MNQMNQTFIERLAQAAEDSFIAAIAKGDWLKIDYTQRIPVGTDFIKPLWRDLNWDHIKEKVMDRVEDKVAETIMNSMATEITTDTKKIMSNTELREELRGYLRQRMKEGINKL